VGHHAITIEELDREPVGHHYRHQLSLACSS
jgi:hypothetical protein